jgi:hypothetical protein
MQEYMRVRAKSILRFDAGLDMRLHVKCRKSVAKFRTALFEVLTWLKVMPTAFHELPKRRQFYLHTASKTQENMLPSMQSALLSRLADSVSTWSHVKMHSVKVGELPDGPMNPPHYDDPWLDDEEEEQQQPVARARKKGGRVLPAASGDVKLPLQLGQHLAGAAKTGCVQCRVSGENISVTACHGQQLVVQQPTGAAAPLCSAGTGSCRVHPPRLP